MAPLVYVVEYNAAEVVFHYSPSSIVLFYSIIHQKLTQYKGPKKMLHIIKLLVCICSLIFKIYVVYGIWKHFCEVFTINLASKI